MSDNPRQTIQGFHGFLGVKADFELLNRELSIAELRGHDLAGHGEHLRGSLAAFYTKQQVDYWRGELPQDAILLGYSMGGRLALQLACKYPDFLRGLILVGVSPGLKTEEEQKKRRKWDRQMAQLLGQGMESFLEHWNKLPIISSQQNIETAHREQMLQARLNQNPFQLQKSMMLFGTGTMPSCWHLLDKIEIPVLLLAGEYDQKYRQIAQKMDAIMPESEVGIVSDAGHCCHLEQPKQTAQIIEKWLKQSYSTMHSFSS